MTLKFKASENVVGNGKNISHHHFLLTLHGLCHFQDNLYQIFEVHTPSFLLKLSIQTSLKFRVDSRTYDGRTFPFKFESHTSAF